MVNAIILINCERLKISEVAQGLTDLQGISEVYSVAGRYDLVAMIRVKTNEEVARVVTEQLSTVAGIEHTETLIAFQAYSKHDLEAMFSVGF